MKRTLVIVCFLWMPVLLRAQMTLSLDLGYGNRGYSYQWQGLSAYNGDLPKGQSCSLAPRVGVRVSEGVEIGLQLGVDYSSDRYTDGFYNPVQSQWQQSATTNVDKLGASARGYVRVLCWRGGSLSLHLEMAAMYGMSWGWEHRNEMRAVELNELLTSRRQRERCMAVQLLPVATYVVSDHVEVDCRINLWALTLGSVTSYQWPFAVDGVATNPLPESTTTQQLFDFGVNALNGRLFTLGFSYVF